MHPLPKLHGTGVACPEADGVPGRWLRQHERWQCFCTSGRVSQWEAGLRLVLPSEEGLGASERGGKPCHTSRNRKKKKSLSLRKVNFFVPGFSAAAHF